MFGTIFLNSIYLSKWQFSVFILYLSMCFPNCPGAYMLNVSLWACFSTKQTTVIICCLTSIRKIPHGDNFTTCFKQVLIITLITNWALGFVFTQATCFVVKRCIPYCSSSFCSPVLLWSYLAQFKLLKTYLFELA